MAAYPRPSIEDSRHLVVSAGQLSINSEQIAHPLQSYSPDRLLRMSNTLQSSLDIREILELFALEVKKTVALDGMRYHNPAHGVELKVGRNGPHSRTYHLTVNEQDLGEIIFTRKNKFTACESNELEVLLSNLVHPLRNGLLYQQALITAQKDPLTGIYNRAALNEILQREVELAHRHKAPLSLIMLDIDHFKRVNDAHGHAAGDCLLKGLVDSARKSIRRCDLLFRYGGEEFVVILNNTDAKGALRLAERIRRNIEKNKHLCSGQSLSMTVSAGTAALSPGEITDDLFGKADKALYRAKSAGRNCVRAAE